MTSLTLATGYGVYLDSALTLSIRKIVLSKNIVSLFMSEQGQGVGFVFLQIAI